MRAGLARRGELAHARHVAQHQRVHRLRLAHAALPDEEREFPVEVRQQRGDVELGRHRDHRVADALVGVELLARCRVLRQVRLVERDHHRDARRVARDEAHVEEGLADRRLGGEQDDYLVHVRGERLLAPLVGAEEEVPPRADAFDRALRGAGHAHLDEVAACRVLALALARAHDLAAVGEFHQELAAEVRHDAALDDDLLGLLAPGRHAA